MSRTSIVIPMLNEERALPQVAAALAQLDPKPLEVIAVDGGSSDSSADFARAQGWRLVETPAGRGRQVNAGVAAAEGDYAVVLHADTIPPRDFVSAIERTLADPEISLAGFTPILRGPDKTRWGTTLHNWAKTWYAPLLFRPHLYLRGCRLLFGDHAMFFRRADFLQLGGCTPGDAVMEEADLCVKFAALGRIRMVRRTRQGQSTINETDHVGAYMGAVRAYVGGTDGTGRTGLPGLVL